MFSSRKIVETKTSLTSPVIALDTCKRLVEMGLDFTCETILDNGKITGWLFTVREEDNKPK